MCYNYIFGKQFLSYHTINKFKSRLNQTILKVKYYYRQANEYNRCPFKRLNIVFLNSNSNGSSFQTLWNGHPSTSNRGCCGAQRSSLWTRFQNPKNSQNLEANCAISEGSISKGQVPVLGVARFWPNIWPT